MLIRCPECQFERNINIDKIPASATVATCPQCETRFRFRDPVETPVEPEPVFAQETKIASEPVETSLPAEDEKGMPESSSLASRAPLPTEEEGDDPLPPGAIIPSFDKPDTRPESQAEHSNQPETQAGPKRSKGTWLSLHKEEKAPEPSAEELTGSRPKHVNEQEEPDEPVPGHEPVSPLAWREREFDGIPWERPESYGFWGSFYHTVLGVMFHPQNFFKEIKSSDSLLRPACFYVLLNFLSFVVSYVWLLSPLENMGGMASSYGGSVSVAMQQGIRMPLFFVVLPFTILFILFIRAFFYHIMIRLAQPDKADYKATVRVLAYSAAPLVLCLVPAIGPFIAMIWFTVASVVGCKYALRLTWSRTVLALVPLLILYFSLLIHMLILLMSVN